MCSWHHRDSATRQTAMALSLVLSYSVFGMFRVNVIRFDSLDCLLAVLAHFGALLCVSLLFGFPSLLHWWWTGSRTPVELSRLCNFHCLWRSLFYLFDSSNYAFPWPIRGAARGKRGKRKLTSLNRCRHVVARNANATYLYFQIFYGMIATDLNGHDIVTCHCLLCPHAEAQQDTTYGKRDKGLV